MSRMEPVTVPALVKRLKRRHAHDEETFHVTRGTRWYSDLGQFHSLNRNNVVENSWRSVADLEEHARTLGVLGAHEEVVLANGESFLDATS